MRHKLALTIALASFCAVTALGAAVAGASSAEPEQRRAAGDAARHDARRRRRPTGRLPEGSRPPHQPQARRPTKPKRRLSQPQPPKKAAKKTTATTPLEAGSNTDKYRLRSRTPRRSPARTEHERRSMHQRSRRGSRNGGVSAPSGKAGARQAKDTRRGAGNGGSAGRTWLDRGRLLRIGVDRGHRLRDRLI